MPVIGIFDSTGLQTIKKVMHKIILINGKAMVTMHVV